MAASAWVVYNLSKKYLMTEMIDLGGASVDVVKMTLHTSAYTPALTHSTYSQVTNELASGNGYSSSGKTLSFTWTVGASASEYRFDATALIWTATGGNIANIKYAVLWVQGASTGARKLICYSQLTTTQFTLSSGSTLTITPSANGIFELN